MTTKTFSSVIDHVLNRRVLIHSHEFLLILPRCNSVENLLVFAIFLHVFLIFPLLLSKISFLFQIADPCFSQPGKLSISKGSLKKHKNKFGNNQN